MDPDAVSHKPARAQAKASRAREDAEARHPAASHAADSHGPVSHAPASHAGAPGAPAEAFDPAPDDLADPGDADASSGSLTVHPRLPLSPFLWLLIGFLCVDAALRVIGLVSDVARMTHLTRGTLQHGLEAFLFATLDVLLCLQLLLRTFAARIFGTLLFLFHLSFAVMHYVVREPDAWLRLDAAGRLQVLGQVVFFGVALVLINRQPASRILRS